MKKIISLILLIFIINISSVYASSGCCSHHNGVSNNCLLGKTVCNDGWVSSCLCEDYSKKTYYSSSYNEYDDSDNNGIIFLVICAIIIGTIYFAYKVAKNVIVFLTTSNSNLRSTCDKCGNYVADDAIKCEHCGATFINNDEKKYICEDCGGSVNETDEKCPHCGATFK